MRCIAIVMACLLACSGKSEQAKPADPEATQAAPAPPSPSGRPVDAGVAVAPVPPDAAPALFLPASLDDKSGIIFAARPGGTVKGIPDGTLVSVVGESGGSVGDMADATVTVVHEGKKLTLVADRVLRGGTVDALHRSPDNQHAVFAPIVACGDLCHSVIWLVSAKDGKRVKVGEGGPDIHVAWHPKGGTVAVGAGALWIVSLADFKVRVLKDYRSPSYSPDGILYARDASGSAYTIGAGKPVRVWEASADAAQDPDEPDEDEGMSADDPRPVEFEDGKPSFDLEWFPH